MNEELPLACDPAALNAQQRARHKEIGAELSALVEEVVLLPDGYALEAGPNAGTIWLKLSGPRGVKEFLAAELTVVRKATV